MKPYNAKPYNRRNLLVAGAACIVIAVSNFSTHDTNAAVFWVFLGVCVFLWASRMKDGNDSDSGFFKIGSGGEPLSKPEQPEPPEAPKPEQNEPRNDTGRDNTPYTKEPEFTAGLGDDQERREEIKSLYAGGVISREEYEERLSQIKKG